MKLEPLKPDEEKVFVVDRKTEAKAKCIWCVHSTGSIHATEVNCFCTDLFAEISKLANYPVYIVMREECSDIFHYCRYYKEDPKKKRIENAIG